jgi:hypothetical protein
MAVPLEIRKAEMPSTFKRFAMNQPATRVIVMENTVKIKPSFPAAMACCKFMPKPKPTTDAFSNQPVALWLKSANGSPMVIDSTKPSNSASGGLIAGLRQSNMAMMKTALRAFGPTCKGGPLSGASLVASVATGPDMSNSACKCPILSGALQSQFGNCLKAYQTILNTRTD